MVILMEGEAGPLSPCRPQLVVKCDHRVVQGRSDMLRRVDFEGTQVEGLVVELRLALVAGVPRALSNRGRCHEP